MNVPWYFHIAKKSQFQTQQAVLKNSQQQTYKLINCISNSSPPCQPRYLVFSFLDDFFFAQKTIFFPPIIPNSRCRATNFPAFFAPEDFWGNKPFNEKEGFKVSKRSVSALNAIQHQALYPIAQISTEKNFCWRIISETKTKFPILLGILILLVDPSWWIQHIGGNAFESCVGSSTTIGIFKVPSLSMENFCNTAIPLLQLRKSYITAIKPCHFIAHHACLFANRNVLENEGWHVKWQRQTKQLHKRAAKETRRPTCWVVPCLGSNPQVPQKRPCFGDPLAASEFII